MPNIPSKSLVTTPRGAGMVHQDGLNNAQPYNNEGYNTFDRSNVHQITQRFADIRPYNCQIAVDGDVVRNRNVFDLSTYTMKSRLLTRVRQHLSAFTVRLSAIMPNTWDMLIKHPDHGQDVPANAYPYFDFSSFMSAFANFDDSGLDAVGVAYIIIALSGMFGHDSLLKYLVYSSPIADEVDDLYSDLVDEIVTKPYAITYQDADANTYSLRGTAGLSSVMDLLERVWRGEFTILNFRYQGTVVTSLDVDLSSIKSACSAVLVSDNGAVRTVLMTPVFAYQMTCAQFYSNSHIDDVYSGRTWLQNLSAYFSYKQGSITFSVNGVQHMYDVCSLYALNYLITSQVSDDFSGDLSLEEWFKVVSNIFAYRNSLRVPDYFVESRLEPLAPGDLTVQVNAGKVSVVDVNEKLWLQRLLNAVNRSNSEINQYLYNMTGIQRQNIEPQPDFVVSETFDIHQQETENTGQAQVSDADAVTSRLSRTESKYMFEIMTDEPETVVLWLQSFSAQYTYPNAIDKIFDSQDRFDFFSSFLQHVGDQNVMTHELDALVPYGQRFAFQLRYAQYKNSLSVACGGFSRGALDTWSLMWPKYQNSASGNTVVVSDVLNSSFIRNHNGDFDKFYTSLTGKDPASRFHFICQFYNITANNSKQQAYPTLI